MSWLLGPAGRAALRPFATDRVLVALDFDGTLAPIVRDRAAAALRPRTLALLQTVAQRYPTLVLTGRSLADAAARLPGVALVEVVGNHGAERSAADPAADRWHTLAQRWAQALSTAARGLPGVEIEDKGLSVTAHYRRAANPARARLLLMRAALALAGGRVVGGKQIVSVLPVDAPHKGQALAGVARRIGARRVFFLGDDETDEDAFGFDLGVPATMVRVGRRQGSRAAFHLRSQLEVDRLLEVLLRLRPPLATMVRETLPQVLEFMRTLWELDHALNTRSKRMLAELGITGPQRQVLRAVGQQPGESPADLARLLHLHPASVTRLVGGLERRRLVAREPNPEDSRRLRLRLTPRGRRVDAARAGTVEAAFRAVLGRAPEQRVAEARALLSALSLALDPDGARERR